jgi:type III restriction enzyme
VQVIRTAIGNFRVNTGYLTLGFQPILATEFLFSKTTLVLRKLSRIFGSMAGIANQFAAKRDLIPNSQALLTPTVQAVIAHEVRERLKPQQTLLFHEKNAPNIDKIVAQTTAMLVKHTIDIPRILVNPTGEVETGFYPFTLDTKKLHLQPSEHELVGQLLRTNEQFHLTVAVNQQAQRLEDYIVFALSKHDDIDYFSQKEILYDLAGQMVQYLLSYLSEADAHNVLANNRRLIAQTIHAQMQAHFWEKVTNYTVQVSRGFTPLKAYNVTANANQAPQSYRETITDVNRIKQVLFTGFSKCLYPVQKFDSDTERRFAVLLERDAQKWFKPVKGQFQIYYKSGNQQPEYIPDFVAEVDAMILMVETKANTDIHTQDVRAKQAAAQQWCKHASDYAIKQGTKPWKYLLIPHDEVNEAKRLIDFLRFQ